MDPLTDILHDLRLESSFYFRSDLSTPWGLSFSAKDGPCFHLIVTGRCFLRIEPRAFSFRQAIWRSSPTQGASDPESMRAEESCLQHYHRNKLAPMLRCCTMVAMERSLLICGGGHFAGPMAHPLLELLPHVLLLRREELEGARSWLDATLTMLERRRSHCDRAVLP